MTNGEYGAKCLLISLNFEQRVEKAKAEREVVPFPPIC